MLLAGELVHRRGGHLLPSRKIPKGRSPVPEGRSVLTLGAMWRDKDREVGGEQIMKYLPPEIRNLADRKQRGAQSHFYLGKCQDQGEEAVEAWADGTREEVRGSGSSPGGHDEGPGTTQPSDWHRPPPFFAHTASRAWNSLFSPGPSLKTKLRCLTWRLSLAPTMNGLALPLPWVPAISDTFLVHSWHAVLVLIFVYVSLFCFALSSPKAGPDLCLLKYLARCLTFSELSINV